MKEIKILNVIASKDHHAVHSLERQGPIVGIDLGTTNSLIAYVDTGKPQIIPLTNGKRTLPSVVHILENSILETGDTARAQRVSDPQHTISSVKRLMGRGIQDLEKIRHLIPYDVETSTPSTIKIKIGEKTYTPIEISALILKSLKESAEAYLGTPVTHAIITVPAYFNDSQRQATRTAGRLAGLQVLRILNEPTAASLAYGLDRKKEGLIAVYDLGGGTFDVSILKLHQGVFEVLSTNGDTQLGGDDMDHLIASHLEKSLKNPQKTNALFRAALLDIAEKLKISLSENKTAQEEILLPGSTVSITIALSRKELATIITPLLERTRKPVEQALQDAGLKAQDLTDVVLVGGPTRLEAVREYVRHLFQRQPNCTWNPDEVVALGAAIQGDILAGNNRELLLLDVTPLSLGIETFGGVMSKIIPRNSHIPTVAQDLFTTFVEGQTNIAINVYQGEREFVKDNRSLAQFKLTGLPPLPAGAPRIEVTFLVDADGILNVTAKDVRTGVEQSIEVRPSFGLTDVEVERMLAAGLSHKDEDEKLRDLVEFKNKAQGVLIACEKHLPDVKDKLDIADYTRIETAVAHLKEMLSGMDGLRIKAAYDELEAASMKQAEALMHKTVKEGLTNKKVADFFNNK